MWNYIKFLGGLLWAGIIFVPLIWAAAAIVVEATVPQSTISAPVMALVGGCLLCVNLIPTNCLPFQNIWFHKIATLCAAISGAITGVFWLLDAEMATVATQRSEGVSPITNWATLKELANAMIIATAVYFIIIGAFLPIIYAIHSRKTTRKGGKRKPEMCATAFYVMIVGILVPIIIIIRSRNTARKGGKRVPNR